MKKYYFTILILILTQSCENDWGNYGGYKLDYEGSIKYYIVLDKGEEIYASDSKAEKIKKGTLVKFHRSTGVIDSLYIGKGGYIVESFVLKNNVSFDSIFILVDQKPLDIIFEMTDKPYPHWKTTPTRKAIKESKLHQYWIINKQTDDVYGPLTKEQYFETRQKLNVLEELQIKIE